MRLRRWLAAVVLVFMSGAAIVTALCWHPALSPVPQPRGFPPELVAQGAALAAIGDCAVCHTQPGGPVFAGGRPLETPFGTVYSGNITPDAETGIGHWSEAAFRRAMQAGIDRSGGHLYPAFPYDHFAHVTEPDLHALYAFLMTRQPVRQASPPDRLAFPFDIRALMAAWNLLFLQTAKLQPDPKRDAAWNRGAYLVEGLGHCGACHRAHNALGAETGDAGFGGGEAEGWYAPGLGAASPSPLPWTEPQLFTYLRQGIDDRHGAAAGPMQAVIHALAPVPDEELHAMATYLAASSAKPPPPVVPTRLADPQAEAIFAGACAGCHAANSPMSLAGRPSLALSSTLRAPDSRDARQIIQDGIRPPPGQAGPLMPAFTDMLTPAQLDILLDYLRARFADAPPWPHPAKGDGT